MSTDIDTETDREARRRARLFDYMVSDTRAGFNVSFPIGYVIKKRNSSPVHCAAVWFQGHYIGDFRFLSDLSPAALAEELHLWLAAAGTDEELINASWAYAPGMLHINDDGEESDWARACTTLILQGPVYA